MEIILDCPLGSRCEGIKDNKLHRCRAYIQIAGRDQLGNEVNEFKCSVFEWQPILLLEIAGTNRGQTAAIESMRNETVIRQDHFISLVGAKKYAIE
jgi:hypothetical protein